MKKKVGIIKRNIAIFLIIAMSINTSAAIVSDNDGSAFITKAEFDALKSSFQSQIDSYNQSIDSKIDGAIASYLAGIKLKTTTEWPILVDNYADIRWLDAHKMKLQYYEYTDNATRTKINADYIHPYYEQHRNFTRSHFLYDMVTVANQYSAVMMNFIFNDVPGQTNKRLKDVGTTGTATSGSNQNSVPTLVMVFGQAKNEDHMTLKDIYHEFAMLTKIIGYGHPPASSTYLYYASSNVYHPASPSGIQIYTPTGKDYWYYYWKADGANRQFTSKMNASNTWIAGHFGTAYLESNHGADATTTIGHTNTDYIYPKHFQWSSSSNQWTNDKTNLQNMMLGTDDDVVVNYAKYTASLNIVDGKAWDWEESEVEPLDVYVTKASYNGGAMGPDIVKYNGIDMSKGRTVTHTFSYPLFPRKSIRELSLGKFKNKNDGTYLNFGSGLPIVQEIDKKQGLKLSFDYQKFNSEYGSATTPNDKIYVSLKKSNFDTVGGTDYWGGKVNGISHSSINAIEVTGGNINIDIEEINPGQQVWLRLANSNTGSEPGMYTKMSNLKILGVLDN